MEIEHKFLIKDIRALKKILAKPHRCLRIEQGYLSHKSPVVRVRIESIETSSGWKSVAHITIKGPGMRVREELEYEIPLADAKKMMKLCGKKRIRKVRHLLGPWEVDEFKGKNKGHWYAEIELRTAKEKLPELPEWIGMDVTKQRGFSNADLAYWNTLC